ncbi:MAG: ABC transporter permease [Bacteroidales bacterium]|nr:ABC transporter permease [Bacteroidales bacterium]
MSVARFISSKIKTGNTIGLISVAVSIFIILVAIAVLKGFKTEIREKASGFMGEAALVAPGQTPVNEHYPISSKLSYRDKLLDMHCVESLSDVAYATGILKTEESLSGATFKGVDSLYNFKFFESCLVDGALPEYGSKLSFEILVSRRLADRMGYQVGSPVSAYFVGEDVRVRKFNVCGIYDAQLEEIDNMLIVTDIAQVRRINGWDSGKVSAVEVNLISGADMDKAEREISELIYNQSDETDDSVFVTTAKRQFPNLFDWLALLDYNVLIVIILMIIVAGFNMMSALLIILFEKTSMIGLLKSLGMSNKGVAKVFRRVGLNIVLKGLAVGNAAAIAVCLLQKYFKIITLDPANYFVKYVPIGLDVASVILADLLSVIAIMGILRLTTFFISRVSPDKTMSVE